jgi:adenylate cyclase class 2
LEDGNLTYEFELRYVVQDYAPILDSLRKMQATTKDKLIEKDLYFSTPTSSTVEKGSIIRIREDINQNNERKIILSYKSPNVLREGVETREEIEVQILSDLPSLTKLLGKIDLKPLVRVTKRRVEYSLAYKGVHFTVTLDDVDSLGSFVEIELMSDHKDDAKKLIAMGEELAAKLNLDKTRKISLGYHEMMLEKGPSSGSLKNRK